MRKEIMSDWNTIPSEEIIQRTVKALNENGIEASVVGDGEQAKEKALSFIPTGAEVMTMTSVTLDALGISSEINTSGNYDAVKPKLMSMDRDTQGKEMQKLGSAPEYSIGSVHAVTEGGKILIASNTGSQIPGYVYGSSHVIWVVGAQKIVKDVDEGFKRLYEYTLPLESERAHKAYGMPGSFISKLLIINKEKPGRIRMIIVRETLGF